MARSAVERIVPITPLSRFTPQQMRNLFILYAKKGITDFMSRQSESIPYTIEVNGIESISENAIGLGGGTISYRLQRLPQVGRYAKLTAMLISPQGPTGEYKQAWFLLVDGKEVSESDIPNDVDELILVNDVPYARKINVRGARLQGIPPGIVERVRQLVLRRFGGFVTANIEFHTLQRGYILKRSTRRVRAGEQLTYPTLVMGRKI